MEAIEKVREHIRKGKPGAALEVLLSVLDGALKDQALLLASRLETINRKEREGILSPNEFNTERNRINKAILEIIVLAAQPPPVISWWIRRARRVWVGFMVAFSILVVIMAFLPKKGFYGKLSVVCERVTFRCHEGGNLLDQQSLSEMKVQNFGEVTLQADSLRLDADGDGQLFETEAKLAESLVTLHPIPETGGSEVAVLPFSLSRLDYSEGALLTLNRTKDKPEELQLDIQQSKSTTAEGFFQDSVTFFASYVLVKSLYQEQEMDNLAGRIYSLSARKVFIKGNAGVTVFYLQFPDSLNVTGRDLRVTDLDFSEKDDDRQLSSILQSTIQMTDATDAAYKTIQLSSGENLLLTSVKWLALTRILINSKGIHLLLEGNIHSLRTGQEVRLQNPSVIEWFWHCHRLLFIIFLVLVLLGIYFSEKSRSKWRNQGLEF